MNDLLDPTLVPAPTPGKLGFGLPVEQNAPVPVSDYDALVAKQQRRAKTSTGDLVGAMWRQDSITNGFMAHLAGSSLEPDPAYNPFRDPNWKDLEDGISEELKPYLYKAHSPAHAQYLKGLLLEKQKDQQMLGDLGVSGNIGRFLLGAVSPENFITGIGAGLVAKGVQASRIASTTKAAKTAIAQATEQAAGVVATVKAGSGASAIAAGTGFGVVENAAFEALRQNFNFEDDGAMVVEAGLIGAAFTAPFAWAGARSMGRISEAASRELEALKALRAASEGEALTPQQGRIIAETHETANLVARVENGELSLDQFEVARAKFSKSWDDLQSSADDFMKQLDGELRGKANDIIDKNFGGGRGPRPQFTLQKAPPMAMVASQAELDAAVRALNIDPTKTPTLEQVNASAPGISGKFREQLQAAVQEGRLRDVEAAYASRDAQHLAGRKEAFEASERADVAARERDYEAAINAREVARMVEEDAPPPQAPVEAPASPVEAPPAAPHALPATAAPDAPTAIAAPVDPTAQSVGQTAASFKGQHVSWMDKQGEVFEGKVRLARDDGFLHVDDVYTGETKVVHHTKIDQFTGGPAPDGMIPMGSVGAMQAHMLGYMDQNSTAMSFVSLPGTNGNVKIPVRFDIYNMLNSSEVPHVRNLGHRLVKDPVAQKDGTPQEMTASEWKSHYKRLIGGRFHVEARDAYQAAVKAAGIPVWRRGEFRQWFYEAIGPVGRGDDSMLAGQPAGVQAEVKKAAGSANKAFAAYLDVMQKAGVKGAEGIPASDTYVNRVWRQDKMREAMALHGKDSVYKLVADSMYGSNSRGPLTGNIEKAKKFVGVIMKLEHSQALQNVHLAGRDMATLRDELKAYNVSPNDIDTIVDTMFEVRENAGTDAGRPAQLKFRMDLDETIMLKTGAGELRLHDLLENDMRLLMDLYGGSSAGHAGMAKVGIKSQAEWSAQMKRIDDEVATDPQLGGPKLARDVAWLDDVRSHILGRPMSMSDYTFTARTASAVRGYTRSVMLGQLGIAAAFEMKQAIGIMGMRAFITQVPSFGSFLSALRKGYFPDAGLARDVMHIGGWGQEKASSYARAREVDEGLAADVLTRFERGANVASHVVDTISGNSSFTSLTKQISAMMSVQRLHDHATGLKPLTGKATGLSRVTQSDALGRLAGQGLEGADLKDVMADLVTHSDTAGDRVVGIRHEDWQKANPESYEKFQLYMSRQVRDAIQDQDLGETMPFMHSTLGKMFSELKTFFLVAHAKNMLKNLHYGDATTLQVFLIGMMGEAMAYAMQQAINNPDKLNEKLSPEVMGKAVMFRMSALGFMPMLVDTGYGLLTGGESLVQPGMTTNTDNRNFLKTPSLTVAGRLMAAPATLSGMVLGTDTTTRKEFKDLATALPGSNTYAMRGVVQWLSESFPKSDPSKSFTP